MKTGRGPGTLHADLVRADKGRSYYLFCAEYCGTNHSRDGRLRRTSWIRPSTRQWLAGGAGSESASAQGGRFFRSAAALRAIKSSPAGQQGRGPALGGLFGKTQQIQGGQVTVDEAYIRESIRNPQAKVALGFQPIMPVFTEAQLSEEQILQLIAYIRSLGPAAAQGATQGSSGSGTSNGTSPTTTGGVSPETQRSNPLSPNASAQWQRFAATSARGRRRYEREPVEVTLCKRF